MRTSNVVDFVDAFCLNSLGGRTGGVCTFGLVDGEMGSTASSSLKKDSTRRRPPDEGAGGMPIKISASRVDSWFVFSRLMARCVAARAFGDGGRGAGFIAWATARGMVGTLTEDTTGPACARKIHSVRHRITR
jgi:hypothetical protein